MNVHINKIHLCLVGPNDKKSYILNRNDKKRVGIEKVFSDFIRVYTRHLQENVFNKYCGITLCMHIVLTVR